MMKKITLEEKIKLITAYAEGKPVEAYDTIFRRWFEKGTDTWDFDIEEYRIKPDETTKFKAGDVVVFIRAAETINPIRYEVTEVTNNSYKFDCMSPCLIEEANENFINERDVLWCVGIYDYTSKKYSMHPTRMTIPEMDKELGTNHDTLSWKPIYPFGFKLKDN